MRNRDRIVRIVVVMMGLTLPLVAGCTSEPLQPEPPPPPEYTVVDLPPQQLFERVQQIVASEPLNLGVAETKEGVIVTGYEQYRGNWNIGRRWQERSRYRVEITPAWNEPTQRSRLQVTAEPEERPGDDMRWRYNPALQRPERAERVLEQILSQLGAAAGEIRNPNVEFRKSE